MSRTTESPRFPDTCVSTTQNLLAEIPEMFQARGITFNPGSLGRASLPGGLVSAEFANAARVILLPAVEDGHVVVSAVGVKLHIKLPESQDDHLGRKRSEGSSSHSSALALSFRDGDGGLAALCPPRREGPGSLLPLYLVLWGNDVPGAADARRVVAVGPVGGFERALRFLKLSPTELVFCKTRKGG